MRTHITIGFFLLLFLAPGIPVHAGPLVPEKGVLDLRNTVYDSQSIYNLNGEWEFYWKQLLSPDNFDSARTEGNRILVKVPSYWESYNIEGAKPGGKGYGTYALTVLLPPGIRKGVCFDIPVFDVAYTFYLNDMLVNSCGKVGTSLEDEEPWYEPSRFCYVPDTDTLQILIQVSNFHHRRGGFWQPMLMGGTQKLIHRTEMRKIFNYSTIGVLFFFTIFFTLFWIFSRKEKAMLLFALTALGMLMRSVNTGLYFSNYFVYTPWTWQIRMEYLGTYLAYLFGMAFLHKMFFRKYMTRVMKANIFLTAILILSIFILPVRLFSYGMLIFQPLIVLFLLHYLVISFIEMIRGRLVPAIFFISLALFLITLVNDILLANSAGSVSGNYLSQLSFQVFIFAMAVVIIMEWVTNYNKRTQLEASLRFRTRVLSVIAHDLKNPVASIAQFSDLLANKPDLAGKKRILDSLNDSSQAALSLLDNLLYWSRSQRDELKLTPVNLNIASVIAEVESLYAHMAVQKGVSFHVEVFPETKAFADQVTLNIIIRNLVSNAIKFTPASGAVTLRVQPEADRVRISVSDTGVGIKPDILELFKSGGQPDSTPGTEREIGTGLGLQLVSDLVRRNGGKLSIESTEGKGSSFSFTLPVKKTKE